MQGMLAALVDELRAVGIEVSVGEHLDAAKAASLISLGDKETLRATLQCAMVKRAEQLDTFNLLFDLYTAGSKQPGAELIAAMSDGELRATLRSAIESPDAQLRRLLADEFVRRFGGLEPGSPVAGVFATIAVNEAAGLDDIRAELLEAVGGAAGGGQGEGEGQGGGTGGGAGGNVRLRLREAEADRVVADLQAGLRTGVLRALVAP